MSSWRLDVVLRVRAGVEDRAAAAHAAAMATRIRLAGAAEAARQACDVARARPLGDTASIAALQRADEHLRHLALEAGRGQVALGAARQAEETARDALLRATRERRILSSLREREERRRLRAREAALEEELMEHPAPRAMGAR